MSRMLQLEPSIPVYVTGKGAGEALGWIDYGKEANLLWVVALDANGEVWLAPNPDVRLFNNYSVGRKYATAEGEAG